MPADASAIEYVAIEYVEASSPAQFILRRSDGKSAPAVTVPCAEGSSLHSRGQLTG
jgi:hypothetical protein